MAVAAVSSTRLARRTRGRGRRRGRRLGRRKPKECEHEGEAAATRASRARVGGVVEVEVIQVHGAPGFRPLTCGITGEGTGGSLMDRVHGRDEVRLRDGSNCSLRRGSRS